MITTIDVDTMINLSTMLGKFSTTIAVLAAFVTTHTLTSESSYFGFGATPIYGLASGSNATESKKSLPLCAVRSSDETYATGTWVKNESIRSYPYAGNEDYEWSPRCTEMENEYLATGKVPSHLKYRWQPESCDLAPFDRKELCRRLDGKTIGFIGDSLQQQFKSSLAGLMLGHLPNKKATNPPVNKTKKGLELCPTDDDNQHSVTMVFRRWDKYQGSQEDRDTLIDIAQRSDYLLINWGVHYQPWAEMENATKDFINVLEEHWQPPQKKPERLFWRSTVVAHMHCEDSTAPLGSTENPFKGNETYHQGDILRQDLELVRPLLRGSTKLDATFLDIRKSMLLRTDGHRVVGHNGKKDCLHYCKPGPTDSWAELFYHHVVMGV